MKRAYFQSEQIAGDFFSKFYNVPGLYHPSAMRRYKDGFIVIWY